MFENFQPLGNQLLVKIIKEERKTESGIWLSESETELFQTGIIMAAGRGNITDANKLIPLQVKVGDKIIFTQYQGIAVDDHLRIIKEDTVLGIIPSC